MALYMFKVNAKKGFIIFNVKAATDVRILIIVCVTFRMFVSAKRIRFYMFKNLRT